MLHGPFDVRTPVADGAVLIRDVGPRDGLQAISEEVSLDLKITMTNGLVDAGVPRVEAGSFVSPKAVPRMADSSEVFAAAASGAVLEALVVNERGAHSAVEAGAHVLVGVISVSETFSQRNVRMSTDQAIGELSRIVAVADQTDTPVSVDVSAAFGCAFEGRIDVDAVAEVSSRVADTGVFELVLADTIGAAAPNDVIDVINAVTKRIHGGVQLGLHLHDTRGLALANAAAGIDAGVRRFDASIGGLGGCPFSPGATGNVCTEDLVHLIEALGFSTGIDLDALIGVAQQVEARLGTTLPSRMLRAGPRFTRTAT